MAEYQRRLRNLNYYSSRCKEYLRIDFQYQCAYCKTHESESISGEKLYEKDHFKPQQVFSNDSMLHSYDNLFYACSICNGKSGKSNKWSPELLNPCKDNIYGLNSHVIYPKDDKDDFKLRYNSKKGKLFIDTFNLNQYDHRQIRRKRWELNKRKNELIQIIREIEEAIKSLNDCPRMETTIGLLKDKISSLKEQLKEIQNPFVITEDNAHIVFKEKMSDFVSLNHINDDYNLDYEFNYDGQPIKCILLKDKNIKFTDGKKMKRINIKDAEVWKNNKYKIMGFLIDLTNKKIYHCDIKRALKNIKIDNTKQTCTIYIDEKDEINEKNINKFFINVAI